MSPDKINVWSDPRVERRVAHLNGRTYGYLYGEPTDGYRATLFLIHGFPDLSVGWRYQIPLFLKMGLRVVVPDLMGYGMTDAPPYTLQDYTYKRACDDIAELAHQLYAKHLILGGHDWGGAVVYRAALYYPQLVSHIFAICTPYFAPHKVYKPLRVLINDRIPNFRYQEQLASGELEEALSSKAEIKSFLNAVFSPWGDDKAFNPERGVNVNDLSNQSPTTLLSPDELEYYALQYARQGLHGPLNWYRTRELNYLNELECFFSKSSPREAPSIEQDVLFVTGTRDVSISPNMTAQMGKWIPRLTRKDVDATHWVLWEKPEEVNVIIKEWMEGVFMQTRGSSKL